MANRHHRQSHRQHHSQSSSSSTSLWAKLEDWILSSSNRTLQLQARIEKFLQHFLSGLYDSIALLRVFHFIVHCPQIRENSLQCLLMNGVLLLGSHYLYHLVLAPLIKGLGHLLYTTTSDADGPPAQLEALVSYGCYVIYQLGWMWPIFLLTFVVSIGLNDGVAEAAYLYEARARAQTEIPRVVGDLVSRLIMVYALLAQAASLIYIPIFPQRLFQLASILLTCWLDAFYAFQYVWARMGIPVADQTARIETQWSYFLGFGLLPSIACTLTPFFVGVGIYSMVFPLYILLALGGEPPASTTTDAAAAAAAATDKEKENTATRKKKGEEGKEGGGLKVEEKEKGGVSLGRAPVFWFARKVERLLIRHVSTYLLCNQPPPHPSSKGGFGMKRR